MHAMEPGKCQQSRGTCNEEMSFISRVLGKPHRGAMVLELRLRNKVIQGAITSCVAWIREFD